MQRAIKRNILRATMIKSVTGKKRRDGKVTEYVGNVNRSLSAMRHDLYKKKPRVKNRTKYFARMIRKKNKQ